MADPRFHANAGPFSLDEIAQRSGASLAAGVDGRVMIADVAPLEMAGPGQISFLDNRKYLESFKASRAAACLVHPHQVAHAPVGMALLISPEPYLSYARTASTFYPVPAPKPEISSRATIDDSARLGAGCRVEAGAVIGPRAEIGQRCLIGPNVVIGAGVVLGDDCIVGAGATVSHALVGNRVNLYPGVRIGQDGFGFAMSKTGHVKVPQLGRVIIEDDVEVGANSTIDRGAGPDTVIGRGCMIDNLVQIGHNVRLGRGCVIVAQSGVSGSTKLDDFVVLGGQAGITGHLHIGMGAQIAAQSGVMRDVPKGVKVGGSPAMPMADWLRQSALLRRMIRGDGTKE